jgi:hypothetical protein
VKRLPNPMGCGRCGIDQRGHAIQAGSDGSHTWQQPTQGQIKERMQARRNGRSDTQSLCGWNPTDATTDCDWDPNCSVHGRSKGSQ